MPLPGGHVAKEDEPASGLFTVSKNLSDTAYERLLDMLLSGDLVGGTTLQERRLAEILNISRTPVREALGRLEAEGLITRHGGRLMTVFKVSPQEFIEVFDVRKLLEVEAAGLAAEEKIDKTTVEHIRATLWTLLETESPAAAEHWAVDDLVHGAIAEAAQNNLLATMIRDLRRRTHIFNTRRIPQRLRPGTLEHLAMIDAVAVGDKTRAQHLMAEHLENAKQAVVAQLVSGRGG
jgi:DNA-binding GntR family transcriptional regulator